tara:strand:+ start:463 stop:627 length:165 start_codon:yes stop_codon:yes gene_type:complete
MRFSSLVVSYYSIDIYDILILQTPDGELLSLKIEEYEPERTKTTEHLYNDEDVH